MKLGRYRKQIIMLLDILIQCTCGLVLYIVAAAQLLPGESGYALTQTLANLALMTVCVMSFQFLLRTYDSLWRYAESKEYLTLLAGAICGFVVYYLLSCFLLRIAMPLVFVICVETSALALMLLMRFAYRVYRKRQANCSYENKTFVAIVGAGNGGVTLLEEIRSNPNSLYYPYCFFDDSPEKIGKIVRGLEVKGPVSGLPTLLQNTPVREIIIAVPSLSVERRREIINLCTQLQCRVKILPSTLGAVKDANLSAQVRGVKIEDLLGRDVVRLDNEPVRDMLNEEVVLVTGGGGSIGSELCRQIASHNPRRLVVVDIYENNVYDLQQELQMQYGASLDLCIEIGSVRDADRMSQIIQTYRPSYIFHAAAHKHVPLMEGCPTEAIKNNVFGTYNVAMAAKLWSVKKFVLISTDKAVNPTNVMGATKRLCEMIVQSMNRKGSTEFCAVRFGNVLGSNGSVIPLFQRQIAQGGPITITDKRIIRYFMSIPEAAQLVLQTGAMAHSGEVFVLDMGDPVKIVDLAENLVRLSGYQPYKDIQITEVGLRPGEKLYEELLVQKDKLEKTENRKIFIDRQNLVNPVKMENSLAELRVLLERGSEEKLIAALRRIVPTFHTPEEVNGQYVREKVDMQKVDMQKVDMQKVDMQVEGVPKLVCVASR